MPGRTKPARSDRGGREVHQPNKLATEVRQSLSLFLITTTTLLTSIGVGLLAGQLG